MLDAEGIYMAGAKTVDLTVIVQKECGQQHERESKGA